ncbi:MAG TPA: cysteine--tRNA ligase [bacterium]|nr:cysteine--tRNA ligase [bacterium]
MLKLYNSLTRMKEVFEPLGPPFVGMYVCGPTVYDEPHLGHAKSYISFDIIVRFLRAAGYRVRYVQNITDVGHLLDNEAGEDRILKKARLERLEPVEVAQKYENSYFRSMDRLNNLRPDISCRATGHIPEMLEMVQALIEKGYAYEEDGNVYFDVRKFAGYGKLSGRTLDELREGVRNEPAEGKRYFADFALWKKADAAHLMRWRSVWGMGFPGWHLECSVMAAKYLGESIDIHGGGLDNQFPHHECEIAQSEAASGKPFVKYWIHNNMVTVEGQKMSKSLGNFVTLGTLFERFTPMTVRFFVLQGHYRSPQDFSDQALEAAGKGFGKLARTISDLREKISRVPAEGKDVPEGPWGEYRERFFAFMEDDFNTAGAITVLFDLAKRIHSVLDTVPKTDLIQAERLFSFLSEDILGFRFQDVERYSSGSLESDLIALCIELRRECREQKLWTLADRIREGLMTMGISLEDGKDGTRWRKKT